MNKFLLTVKNVCERADNWNWEAISSIATSIGVITALVFGVISIISSKKQVENSNKQHLFDKRVENYLIVRGLIELYDHNLRWFNKEETNEPELAIDQEFIWLTNNSHLESLANAIQNPLEQPGHRELLAKLDELKIIAYTVKFLFADKPAEMVSDFVLKYRDMLFVMYRYRTLIKRIVDENERETDTLENLINRHGEPAQRETLYAARNEVKKSYAALKKAGAIEKIEEQIKLKMGRK
jgi:hypothetical protein